MKSVRNLYLMFFIVNFLIINSVKCQPIFHDDYNEIISDSVKGTFGVREKIFSNKKFLEKNKHNRVLSLKYYENNKIVYFEKFENKFRRRWYHVYDDEGRLSKTIHYYNKDIKYETYYFYKKKQISKIINNFSGHIYTTVFDYDSLNNILEEICFIDNWKYYKRRHVWNYSPFLIARYSIFSDTMKNFSNADTCKILYFDKLNNISIVHYKDSTYALLFFKKNNNVQRNSFEFNSYMYTGVLFSSIYSENQFIKDGKTSEISEVFNGKRKYYLRKDIVPFQNAPPP